MDMTWLKAKKMLDRDALLERLGLEERSPTGDFFGGLGLFAVGVLVGAGLGLLFAPRRGEEMRTMVTDRLKSRTAGQDDVHHLGVDVRPSPSTL